MEYFWVVVLKTIFNYSQVEVSFTILKYYLPTAKLAASYNPFLFSQKIVQNPFDVQRLGNMLEDKRVLTTISIMFGLDAQMPMDVDPPAPEKKTEEPPKKQEPEKPKYDDLPENRRLALQEKDQGNECYKKKDFDNALKHYQKAVEHDPTDITFYTNMAAVYFEQKEYEKCIKECEKAIDIGRENRADFKLIAKAFTRIGKLIFFHMSFIAYVMLFKDFLVCAGFFKH